MWVWVWVWVWVWENNVREGGECEEGRTHTCRRVPVSLPHVPLRHVDKIKLFEGEEGVRVRIVTHIYPRHITRVCMVTGTKNRSKYSFWAGTCSQHPQTNSFYWPTFPCADDQWFLEWLIMFWECDGIYCTHRYQCPVWPCVLECGHEHANRLRGEPAIGVLHFWAWISCLHTPPLRRTNLVHHRPRKLSSTYFPPQTDTLLTHWKTPFYIRLTLVCPTLYHWWLNSRSWL